MMKKNSTTPAVRLIRDARPELSDTDVLALATEIRGVIDRFVPVSAEPVTYVAIHWRDWVSNRRAASGYSPGKHQFGAFLDDDPRIAEIRTESGSLYEGVVWTATAPDTPESLEALEAAADRAYRVHWRCKAISTHGHDLFLKRFWPDADTRRDLVSDAPPEMLIKALSRADARSLALGWARHELHALTRPDTAFVLRALDRVDRGIRTPLSGPVAVEVAKVALEQWRDGQDHPDAWREAALDGLVAAFAEEAVSA
jgi:hypothetical protein